MQKIIPFLWFNNNAEEAMDFYMSVFKNSKSLSISRYGKGGPGPEGSVLVASFELEGQRFNVLNGGPMFTFNPAISLVVMCEHQTEVDYYWEKLSEGGEKQRCAWLKDKFGISWQIVPTLLGKLMSDPDKEKAGRVMQAMLKMDKLDIATLQRAFDQE
ncbi:VOC family protein [soil metagenome]